MSHPSRPAHRLGIPQVAGDNFELLKDLRGSRGNRPKSWREFSGQKRAPERLN